MSHSDYTLARRAADRWSPLTRRTEINDAGEIRPRQPQPEPPTPASVLAAERRLRVMRRRGRHAATGGPGRPGWRVRWLEGAREFGSLRAAAHWLAAQGGMGRAKAMARVKASVLTGRAAWPGVTFRRVWRAAAA